MARSAHERTDRGGGEDERQAQPEAVDGEQRRAAGDGVPAAGDGENGRQDRADAGRPAEGEGEAHRIGAPYARRLLDLEPLLAQHRADPEHAEKMQAHHDDADPGGDRQRMAPLPEQRSQRRSRRAQRDEHGREAGHEQERGDQHVAPRLRLAFVDQRFDARARKIAKIGRRQRQHAGRNKRDQARAEGGGKGNVSHDVTDGPSATARQMPRRDQRRLANWRGRDTASRVAHTKGRPRRPGLRPLEAPYPAADRGPASGRAAARNDAKSGEAGEHHDPGRGLRHGDLAAGDRKLGPGRIAFSMSFTAAALSANMSAPED